MIVNQCGCREPNLGLLQGEQVLLTTEPSFQSPVLELFDSQETNQILELRSVNRDSCFFPGSHPHLSLSFLLQEDLCTQVTGICLEPTHVSSTHIPNSSLFLVHISFLQVLGESRPSHISPLSRKTRVWGWLGPFSDEVILFGPRLTFVCGS